MDNIFPPELKEKIKIYKKKTSKYKNKNYYKDKI